MEKKKFRTIVGQCGPTTLCSNIIVAENKREAVIKLLGQTGEPVSDTMIQRYMKDTYEVQPMEAPEKLLDYAGKEISVGDSVVFIKNYAVVDGHGRPPKLLTGTVTKLGAKGIVIDDGSGHTHRINLSRKYPDRLVKVIVMNVRLVRQNGTHTDATGYPIEIGDTVVFMGERYQSTCETLKMGKIEAITEKTVMIDGERKYHSRIVVVR